MSDYSADDLKKASEFVLKAYKTKHGFYPMDNQITRAMIMDLVDNERKFVLALWKILDIELDPIEYNLRWWEFTQAEIVMFIKSTTEDLIMAFHQMEE